MKTKPMGHQKKGLKLLEQHDEFYGLGCEQGTGKTWMLLAEAEKRCAAGEIDALVVIAPNGVHTNWTRREAPAHLEISVDALAWVSGPGVWQKKELERILLPRKVRGDLLLFAMNIDALNTDYGYKYLRDLLKTYRCMLVVDESSRIKSLKSGRTERMIECAPLAAIRRIASGTMMPNGPPDLFSQMEFLSPGGELLGTSSFRAFVSEYAETLPANHGTMRHIMVNKFGKQKMAQLGEDYRKLSDAMRGKIDFMTYASDRLGRRWRPPQIIAKDAVGMPVWRNLDKLQKLIKPWVYRVLKKDCMDLPPKIHQVYSFNLSKKQMEVYKTAEEKLRYQRDNGEIDTFTALTKIVKLRQIVSNFIMLDDEATTLLDPNPRLDLLRELLEDVDGQFIIWACFHEEIDQIVALLKEMEISFVEYHGRVKKGKAREEAIDNFQAGKARGFIGNRQSGGIGLTLTNAMTTINFSHDYRGEDKQQSEDRNHRKGSMEAAMAAGVKGILYIDLVAEGTIDERLIMAHHRKEETASAVLNYL